MSFGSRTFLHLIGCISEHCAFLLVAIFDARLKVPEDACAPNSCLLCWYLYVLCAVLLVRAWKMILQLSLLITKKGKQIPHSFTLLMLWRKSSVDLLAFTQLEKLQQSVGFWSLGNYHWEWGYLIWYLEFWNTWTEAYGFLPCCSFKYLSFFKGCKCWEMFFVNPLVTARILWIAGIVIILMWSRWIFDLLVFRNVMQ